MSTRRVALAAIAATVLAVPLASCGSGGASATGASGDGLSKSEITVGMLPIIDAAPLYIAKQKGFFQQEGLTLHISKNKSSSTAASKVGSGQLDFAFASWTAAFEAAAKGLETRVVAEGYVWHEGTLPLLALPDSEVKEPADLAGKKIAVLSPNDIQALLIQSRLESFGIDPDKVHYVPVPFPQMGSALKSGEVDVVAPVEPFITKMQQKLGAEVVMNTVTGSTANFPASGYVTSKKFHEKHPKTVAAFQRALQHGQRVAHKRAAVEKILPTYTKINPETAAILKLGSYPTSTDATRLQRVADLMHQIGSLKKSLDVEKLIIPAPSS